MSFMNGQVDAVHPMACATFEEVAAGLPCFIEDDNERRLLHSASGYLNPSQFEEQQARHRVKAAA